MQNSIPVSQSQRQKAPPPLEKRIELPEQSISTVHKSQDPELTQLSNKRDQEDIEDTKQDANIPSYMDETGLTEYEAEYHAGRVMDIRKFDDELNELDRGIVACSKVRNFIIYGICILGIALIAYKISGYISESNKEDLIIGETGEFILDSYTVGYYLLQKYYRPAVALSRGLVYLPVPDQPIIGECFSSNNVSGIDFFTINEAQSKLILFDSVRTQSGDRSLSCCRNSNITTTNFVHSFGMLQTITDSKKVYNWTLHLQPGKPGQSGSSVKNTQIVKELPQQLNALFPSSSEDSAYVGARNGDQDSLVFISANLETITDSKVVKLPDKRKLGITILSLTSVYSDSRLVAISSRKDELLIIDRNNGYIIKRIDVSGLRTRLGIVVHPLITPLTSITSDESGALYLSGDGWPAVVKIRIAKKHFKIYG
jgi:hypothetical protein